MGRISTYGFQGLDELKQVLKEMPSKIDKNALRAGMKEGAQMIQESAKNKCPVATSEEYPDMEPGALRDNIVVRSQRKGRKPGLLIYYIISRPPRVHRNSKKTVPLDYGFWVERGHMTRGKGRGTGTRHIPPHSFMRAGFEAVVGAVSSVILERVKTYIERSNARAAARAGGK